MNDRAVLHVHAWVEHGAEDCVEVSGKLGRVLVCVHREVSPHLHHTLTLVVWIGSLYCWNNPGTDCGIKERQYDSGEQNLKES